MREFKNFEAGLKRFRPFFQMSSSNQPNVDKRKNIVISKNSNNNNQNQNRRPPPNTTPQSKSDIEVVKRDKSAESLKIEFKKKIKIEKGGSPAPKTDLPKSKNESTKPRIEYRSQQNNKKIKFQFKLNVYTIEEALEFRKAALNILSTYENKKVSDESFIKMASLLNRFKFTQQHGRNNPKVRNSNRTDYEKQEHKITTELNKLTLDNFMSIIDTLTMKEENFLDQNYLKMLAKSLVKQASLQPLFSSLYSLSATSISSVLDNTEYSNSRQAFCQTLIEESQKAVEDSINLSSKFAPDSAIGSASFFGFLANREFVSIDICFKLVQKTTENVSSPNVEICRQLLIPAGEKIEAKFPDEFKKVVKILEDATKDKNIPGSVRYPLIDLLEARKNDWNTKPLMHVIASTKKSSKARADDLTQMSTKRPEKEPSVTIQVAKNKFAALLGDDDDDIEYDEEPGVEENEDDGSDFDGEDMIRRYVIDNEISPNWSRSHVADLLYAIALRPNKEISKAMKLLQILNDENNFATNEEEETNAFEAICKTVEKCSSNDDDYYKHAMDNCGTIFARLVYFGISSVDQFGEVFPIENFRITVILSFLTEIIKVKKIQLIKESEYWTQYKWRPENISNLEIAKSIGLLPEAVYMEIFDIFPLYDCLWTLQDDVEYISHKDENDKDENDENVDLESEFETFPPDVIADPAFASGAIEVLFKANSCFDIVLPMLEQNKLTVLLFVEKYGEKELRDTKEIVRLIKNIAHSGNYDLESFLNYEGDEKHQKIVQYLKENK